MTTKQQGRLAKAANNIDERYTASGVIRPQINKVFPTHWSFMLGEIALYSFIILILSGVYLTLFFDPSMSKVIYDGAYAPLNGVEMSRAYATALDISFEVRGGLFIRQVIAELRKVVVPSRRELVLYSITVLLFVAFMILLIFGLDAAFSWISRIAFTVPDV